jgi:RimJ/RimL family protein N-acetyltransferase
MTAWPRLATRLEGRIVTLEPLEPRHSEELRAAAADPAIWRWMPLDASSPDGFARWLDVMHRETAAGESVPFATIDRASGRPIGSTTYRTLRPEHKGLEIGFTWLARSAWNTGANAEAKLLMLEHAFERLGWMRVEFKTDARNAESRRALEALPARFEGIFRKHMLILAGVRDSAYYAIVDDEWPEVRANLERRLAAKLRR